MGAIPKYSIPGVTYETTVVFVTPLEIIELTTEYEVIEL